MGSDLFYVLMENYQHQKPNVGYLTAPCQQRTVSRMDNSMIWELDTCSSGRALFLGRGQLKCDGTRAETRFGL